MVPYILGERNLPISKGVLSTYVHPVNPRKESGQNLYRQYAGKKGKIVLDAHWVHECVKAGELKTFAHEWGGCKVNGTEMFVPRISWWNALVTHLLNLQDQPSCSAVCRTFEGRPGDTSHPSVASRCPSRGDHSAARTSSTTAWSTSSVNSAFKRPSPYATSSTCQRSGRQPWSWPSFHASRSRSRTTTALQLLRTYISTNAHGATRHARSTKWAAAGVADSSRYGVSARSADASAHSHDPPPNDRAGRPSAWAITFIPAGDMGRVLSPSCNL